MDAIPGSPAFPWYETQSLAINNLIPHIDATYCTNATPGQRAWQGMSMGGQGALLFGFNYPQLFSSIYAFAPATDDNMTNIAVNEPAQLANMFSGSPTAFQEATAWNVLINNHANINGLPIHITIGDQDNLYTVTTYSPFGAGLPLPGIGYNGTTAHDMIQLMTNVGVAHDALQVVTGCPHDLNCLENGGAGVTGNVNGANFTYAASHFH